MVSDMSVPTWIQQGARQTWRGKPAVIWIGDVNA